MRAFVKFEAPPPLAIIQARLNSRRLPGKMLLPIGDETLLERVYKASLLAFANEDNDHVVIAIPGTQANVPLIEHAEQIAGKARVFLSDREEWDVLGRFADCARTYRWDPESVIMRITPDDPFKDPVAMQMVAQGCRYPVEFGGEAFTMADLHAADRKLAKSRDEVESRLLYGQLGEIDSTWEVDQRRREHLTYAFFDHPAPPAVADHPVTIDTWADYEGVCAALGVTPTDRAAWEAQYDAPEVAA